MMRFQRKLVASAVVAGLSLAGTAQALEFDLGGTTVKVGNLVTVGALMRMQDRDSALVGKSSQAKLDGSYTQGNGVVGLCVSRDGDDGVSGPNGANNTYRGDTCSGTRDRNGMNANDFYLSFPGSLTPNGDNGNLNFDKYDIGYATAKVSSDISFELGGINFFTRTVGYLDGVYTQRDERRADTTFQTGRQAYPSAVKNRSGKAFEVLDYFASRRFEIGDRQYNIKVGNQVLNWGESSFLLANSLNSINPANQALLRLPGFDLKELLQPVGMVLLEGDIVDGANFQAFYQYD